MGTKKGKADIDMEYMKFDDAYVVRLDRGEEIVESLTKICDREKITLATIEGIGAADHAVIGLYNVGEQVYHKTELNGPMEITALTGNVSTMDGKTYLHIHINLCDEKMNVKGGHLNECRISATAEITIRTVNGKVERFYDKNGVGLNLYQFPGNEGYKKLLKNLIDVIKEDHAKLGFRKEKIRLYYPLSSLNHFFGTSDDADQMQERLNHLPVVITEMHNGGQICRCWWKKPWNMRAPVTVGCLILSGLWNNCRNIRWILVRSISVENRKIRCES